MKCLLHISSTTLSNAKQTTPQEDIMLAVHPNQSLSEPYGSLKDLRPLAEHTPLFLVVHEDNEDIIYSQIKNYAPHKIAGIISTFATTPSHLQRLHTILSVIEAEHYVTDGTLKL